MTWTDIAPVRSVAASGAKHPIMMAGLLTRGGRPFVLIALRPALWPGDVPAWLAATRAVRVQLGDGAERGQLRLTPNGPFRIGAFPKSTALQLRLPKLAHQPAGKQAQSACEFDWQDEWISITLPDWCRPKPAVPQPPLSPEAARRWNRPGDAA